MPCVLRCRVRPARLADRPPGCLRMATSTSHCFIPGEDPRRPDPRGVLRTHCSGCRHPVKAEERHRMQHPYSSTAHPTQRLRTSVGQRAPVSTGDLLWACRRTPSFGSAPGSPGATTRPVPPWRCQPDRRARTDSSGPAVGPTGKRRRRTSALSQRSSTDPRPPVRRATSDAEAELRLAPWWTHTRSETRRGPSACRRVPVLRLGRSGRPPAGAFASGLRKDDRRQTADDGQRGPASGPAASEA